MNQTKRIVIIEGDAFDADAIVAITKSGANPDVFYVNVRGADSKMYNYASRASRIEAMHTAIDAWRAAVGDVDKNVPLPPPPPDEPDLSIIRYWSDEKGRYYETYSGSTIFHDATNGNFIWNMGPPMRKNPLGEGASPINRVYVGEDGRPLDPQPV